MRIAVFSDIHGNLQALKSTLEQKVVSVSASGLDDPSYLLIEASEDELRYEHMNIVDR